MSFHSKIKLAMSSGSFFWLNIDCVSSRVRLIHLRKFLTQGICLLAPSPIPPPPSHFGDLNEWEERGPLSSSLTSANHNDVIVKEHFTSGNSWQSSRTRSEEFCSKKLDICRVKKVTPAFLIIKWEMLQKMKQRTKYKKSLDMPREV